MEQEVKDVIRGIKSQITLCINRASPYEGICRGANQILLRELKQRLEAAKEN